MDLWAARCGVLHTQTPDSDLSAEGEARRIRYRLQSRRSLIQSPGKGKSYTLNPLGLAEKVEKGIAAWLSDMERDAAKHADFCDRAARVFDPSAFVRWPLERRLSPNLCKRKRLRLHFLVQTRCRPVQHDHHRRQHHAVAEIPLDDRCRRTSLPPAYAGACFAICGYFVPFVVATGATTRTFIVFGVMTARPFGPGVVVAAGM